MVGIDPVPRVSEMGRGRGGREMRADVRLDGSRMALKCLEDVSRVERMVRTSLE